MADIKQLKVGSTTYDIKDGTARDSIAQLTGTISGKSVKDFGAKGDGTTDDLLAIQNCLDWCSTNNKIAYFPSGTYAIKDILRIPSCQIEGLNATVLIHADFRKDLAYEEFGITNKNFRRRVNSISDKIIISNLTFELGNTSKTSKPFALNSASDCKFTNCKFICMLKNVQCTPIDIYGNCKNILFDKCEVSFDLRNTALGCVQIREVDASYTIDGVKFLNCNFYKNGGSDEVLAVWGWNGTVRNVIVDGCKIIADNITDNVEETGHYPIIHVFTFGQTSGVTENIIFRNNYIYAKKPKTSIFFLDSSTTTENNKNIRIENNTIILGGIYSTGDSVCRQVVAFRDYWFMNNNVVIQATADFTQPIINQVTNVINNNFDLKSASSSQYAFVTCKNVVGNKITLTTLHGLFQNCYNISKNDVTFIDNGTIDTLTSLVGGVQSLGTIHRDMSFVDNTIVNNNPNRKLSMNFSGTSATGINTLIYSGNKLKNIRITSSNVLYITMTNNVFETCTMDTIGTYNSAGLYKHGNFVNGVLDN